jgi:hypothetical protein
VEEGAKIKPVWINSASERIGSTAATVVLSQFLASGSEQPILLFAG